MVYARVSPEVKEELGHKLAFAVGVDRANRRAGQCMAKLIDGSADGGVERCDDALDCVRHFGLEFDKLNEHVAGVFIDGEDHVAVAADGEHELLEIHV